jgi:hypothetical protein
MRDCLDPGDTAARARLDELARAVAGTRALMSAVAEAVQESIDHPVGDEGLELFRLASRSATPVHYVGGPLDGQINDQDYGVTEEIREGWVFDYPTRSATGAQPVGAADTVERYVLEQRGGRWSFVHTGTFEQPIEQTAFHAVVVGGPEDGTVKYLLGTARRHQGTSALGHIVRGCVLHHSGDDPVTGWELRYRPVESAAE